MILSTQNLPAFVSVLETTYGGKVSVRQDTFVFMASGQLIIGTLEGLIYSVTCTDKEVLKQVEYLWGTTVQALAQVKKE